MSLPPLRDDPAETNTTKLRKIAEKLVENAMDGDIQAIKEVADRLDGKASQAIIGDEESPVSVVHKGVREIVRPASARPL